MQTLGPIVAIVVFAALYCVVGTLLLLVAVRIGLALAGAFGLPDALGAFGADVSRAYRAASRVLDREFGGTPPTRP